MLKDQHKTAARRQAREPEHAVRIADRAVKAFVAELDLDIRDPVSASGLADDAGERLILNQIHAAPLAQIIGVAALVMEAETHRPVIWIFLAGRRLREILDHDLAGGHAVKPVDSLLAAGRGGNRHLRPVRVRKPHRDAVDAGAGIVGVGHAASDDGAAPRMHIQAERSDIVHHIAVAQPVNPGAAAVHAFIFQIAGGKIDGVHAGVREVGKREKLRYGIHAQCHVRREAAIVEPFDVLRFAVNPRSRNPFRVGLRGAFAEIAECKADRRPLADIRAAFAPAIFRIHRKVVDDNVGHVRTLIDGKRQRDPRRVGLQPDMVDRQLVRPVMQSRARGRLVLSRQEIAQPRHL